MRQYIFGTGLLSAITGGITLLRALRNDEPFTWRTALAWLSWGITLALAIGSVVDTRRARRGRVISGDSPVAKKQQNLLKKRLAR
jgi:hypothetical protein